MAESVSSFINKSYIKSGIIAPEYESAGPQQIADGLELLNEIIVEMNIDGDVIPYRSTQTIQTIPNQDTYTIGPIIRADTVSYTWGNVRYYAQQVGVTEFRTSPRAMNISSLPFQYFLERLMPNQMNISFYFVPKDIYTITISGLIPYSELTLTDPLDLKDIFEDYFIVYLKYALANRLCMFNQITTPEGVSAHLNYLYNRITDITVPDLTINRTSGRDAINYQQVNFGQGWIP